MEEKTYSFYGFLIGSFVLICMSYYHTQDLNYLWLLVGEGFTVLVWEVSNEYSRKEAELTAVLVSRLGTDEIDLRILNVLPLVLQYHILKEGILILTRDEMERVEFETSVMIRFFELKPYLDEYWGMFSLRIRGA